MTGETAAAAIVESGVDFPNVTCRDLGAAQGAMDVDAWHAVIDENKAEHIGPPLGIGFTAS
jgi:hypothetical protein